MQMVFICQYMGGWDFYKYNSQPDWFLELIKFKIKIDAEKQK